MQGGLGVTDIFSKKGNGLKHQTINLSGTFLLYCSTSSILRKPDGL